MADPNRIDGEIVVGANTAQARKDLQELSKQAKQTEKDLNSAAKGKGPAGTAQSALNIQSRNLGRIAEQEAKMLRVITESEQRRVTQTQAIEGKKQLAQFRADLAQKNILLRQQSGASVRGGFFRMGGPGARIAAGAASALGIGAAGFGAFAAIQTARGIVSDTQTATAYERQRVAAEGLAGSQAKLNELLVAYNQASGGAVDNVTALSNVTRLLATGYAKTVPEAERFVRATRGASIALGRPQEEITQETQLAISNTSVKRLDQIGLGIEEVNDRIEELRKTNANWTRETAFQEAVLSVMEEKYGHLTETLEGQATGLERLTTAWINYRLELGKNASTGVNVASGALADALNSVPKINRAFEDFTIRKNEYWFNRMSEIGMPPTMADRISMPSWTTRFMEGAASRVASRRGASERTAVSTPGTSYSDETLAGLRDFERNRSQIEENFQQQRIDATEQYESSRTNTIRNYEKQIAREAEDFAIRRSRANRDYQKSVEDVIEDAARRDEEMVEDYTERVSEAREDSEKRLSKINEEYQKQREKSAAEHRDRLLSAAGRLDAIAVLEERKRYRREQEEAENAHKEQIEDARDSLAEQIEDAQEAHEERLEDARRADRERLDDMEEARRQQMQDEDEDRALQLSRAAEDHDDQLAELDRQHGLRMKQIEDQAAKEREQWNQEFEDFLVEHNIYVKGLTEKREKVDKLTIEWLDNLVEELEKRLENLNKGAPEGSPIEQPTIPEFARGGRVGRTGPAVLHAGEFVLSRGMLAGSQPVPAGISNSMSNKSIVVQSGAIALYPSPGDTEGMLSALEDQLVEILDRV